MKATIGCLGIAACAVSVSGFVMCLTPTRAIAQVTSSTPNRASDIANKKVDLDLESTNLYQGLKLLFSKVNANFTINESLRSLTVTAHLTQVPFRVALETLLKSAGTPLTYKVENDIYCVVPKVEEAPPVILEMPAPQLTRTTGSYRVGIIRPGNVSSIDIVQAVGGHIVSVGYDAKSYGTGGLGGLSSSGVGGVGGGGVGGFGGNGYGGYTSGYGGYDTSDSGYRPGITSPGPPASQSGGSSSGSSSGGKPGS